MNPKEKAAQYAFEKIEKKFHKDFILGIGTGSTTNCFIEILKEKKPEMKCFVSSSSASSDLLKDAYQIAEKSKRQEAVAEARDVVKAEIDEEDEDALKETSNQFKALESDIVRTRLLNGEPRIDGRDLDTV